MNESQSREDLLTSAVLSLTESQSELREFLQEVRKAGSNSASTVHINAGGIVSGAAVSIAIASIFLFVVLAVWTSVQLANMKSEQQAWTQVWQSTVANAAAELKKSKE